MTQKRVKGRDTQINSKLIKILISLLVIGIATALQWILQPTVLEAPYLLYYPAVLIGSLYGNGFLTVTLSVLASQYFFIPPYFNFFPLTNDLLFRHVIYALSASMICMLTKRLSSSLRMAQNAETRLMTTLGSIGDAVIVTNLKGQVKFMNSIAEALTGWKVADAMDKDIEELFKIFDLKTQEQIKNPIHEIIEKKESLVSINEALLINKNQFKIYVEDKASLIQLKNKELIGGILVFRDVTERHVQLENLDQERRRLEAVIQEMPAGIVLAQAPSGEILMRNNLMDEILGGFIPINSIQDFSKYIGFNEKGRKYGAFDWPVARSIINGEIVSNEEVSIKKVNGDFCNLSISSAPIRNSKGQIIAAVGVHIDITKAKKIEKDLQNAVLARDDFLSMASHELKTPLTTLKLQTQMMIRRLQVNRTEDFDYKKMISMLESDNKQLDRINRLIDDMLDISRINSGKLIIEKRSFDLTAMVKEVISRNIAQVDEYGVTLNVVGEEEIIGKWDRLRVEQIVTNLLTNALKYGNRTPITVSILRRDKEARIMVKDEGPGIAKSDQEKIFNRFERVAGKEITGLGLGLFITRKIVEMHEGRIFVESELGKGATFIVDLPLNM
ncbi:MAG: ATP-binding protein [Bacteriovoracaceae bacterium]